MSQKLLILTLENLSKANYTVRLEAKCSVQFVWQEEEVEMMDDDDDDDDDIPTILVGGEEVDITDVTPDIIARMTTEEMERYNQVEIIYMYGPICHSTAT